MADFQTVADHFDLTATDANTHVAGNKVFVLQSVPGRAGALWLGGLYLCCDMNGDGFADLSIVIGTRIVGLGDIWM